MGTLELRREPSGLRHCLDGREVHAGQVLELRLAKGVAVHEFSIAADDALMGVWLRGRYEWNHTESDPPRFYVDLYAKTGGDDAEPVEAVLRLPPSAVLRWPVRR